MPKKRSEQRAVRRGRTRRPYETRIRREVEEEIAFHIEACVERLVAGGMSRPEAEREAERKFGDRVGIGREYTELRAEWEGRMGWSGWLDRWVVEVRHALRGLRRTPGTTVAAILVTALGIGANAAVFSVVSGILAGSASGVVEEGLFTLREEQRERDVDSSLSPPTYWEWKEAGTVEIAAHTAGSFAWADGAEPVYLRGAYVSANFLRLVGTEPVIGRSFTATEDASGGPEVAVITDGLWSRIFGRDPAVLGRTVRLSGRDREIVGVLPPGFSFPSGTEVYVPLEPSIEGVSFRGARFLDALARPRPGVTVEVASAELDAISTASPEAVGTTAMLVPRRDHEVQDVRRALVLLMASVAFVLVIAVSNAGNLLLARALRRRREQAIRHALGAGRLRIVFGSVADGVAVGVIGGGLGFLLAGVAVNVSPALLEDLPGLDRIRVDAGVLLFTAAVSLGAGIVAGLIPGLRVLRSGVGAVFEEGSRGATRGPRAAALRTGLVAIQIALAVVLVSGAGLLLRSLSTTLDQDPGFATEDRSAFMITLASHRHPDGAARAGFVAELLERLEGAPGVEKVTVTQNLPIAGRRMISGLTAEGPEDDSERLGQTEVEAVRAGYFEVLGIEVRRGRDFSPADRDDVAPVALVNEAFVRDFLGDEPGLGRLVRVGFGGGLVREIVGVVADARHESLTGDAAPKLYFPLLGDPGAVLTFVVESSLSPSARTEVFRDALRSVDPEQPLSDAATLADLVDRTVARPRSYATLLGSFGGVALLLTLTGYAATLAGFTTERRREIGIRMALGADVAGVRKLIIRQGLAATVLGITVGVTGALALGRVLEGLLFRVRPADPLALGGSVALLLVTSLVATWLPVRRATRVDPVKVLNSNYS